jgi:hypothetical protein
MKTRQELILDFMLALAANSNAIFTYIKNDEVRVDVDCIVIEAVELADRYLEGS